MNEQKRISSEDILNITNDYYYNFSTLEWHGIEIEIQRTISGYDAESFVNAVLNNCFNEIGDYLASEKDYSEKLYLIEFYTNIDMPDSYAARYDILYRTDIVTQVLSKINIDQFNTIRKSIEDMIAYKKDTYIENLKKQSEEFFEQLSELSNIIGVLFSDINKSDVDNLFNAVTDGVFDDNKVVDLYKKVNNNPIESEVNGTD